MKMKRTMKFPLALVVLMGCLPLNPIPSYANGDVANDNVNDGVKIDDAFSNENFRRYVKQYDTDGNGYLSQGELDNVTDITIEGKSIDSLKGIEYFNNLQELHCNENNLTSLDLSKNKKLIKLYCSNNKLISLKVSENKNLTELGCDHNKLKSLNVSNNTELSQLYCDYNKLTSLDLSQNTKLTRLAFNNNNLMSVDVSYNTNFTRFDYDSQQYDITVIKGKGEFKYSNFPEKFNKDKVKSLVGAKLGDDALIVDSNNPSEVTFKYKVAEGKEMDVKLKVTYKDAEKVEVPDTTAPTITVEGTTRVGILDYIVKVTKMENFPELTVKAKDDNLDESTLRVTIDEDWLEFDKTTKKIKLKTGNTVPNTATNANVTISVKDKAGNEALQAINVIVKSQAVKYTPKAKSDTPTRKVVGEKVNSPKDYVENTDKNTQFPANTTFKWKENNAEKDEITLNKVGKDQEKEIEITYPDGSHETVKVKFNVVADINLEKQDDEPVYLYETLVNNHDIQFANQDKVKAKVKGIPDGATITYSKVTSKQGKNYVTVTVEKDGVKKSLDIEVVGDTTDPTITIDGTTPIRPEICEVQVTRMENFPELTVKAEDDNLDESTLSVTPDVDWLEFDKTTKKIKLKTGNTSVPKTAAAYVRVRISVADKTGNTSYKTLSVTVKSQADKYKPVAKDTVNNKNRGDKAGEAKNYVKLEGNNQFPENTTFKWKEDNQTKDDIDLDTPGDNIEKTIEITYPDGSGSSVKVKFNVAKTNLTEPTISEKDNGDIEIQAGPNATSLELTYKDKADKEKTATLTKTGGAWTNLPAGFSANGDKITLSHESTKEGSTVKAKSKADNYNDSNEKTLTRTKTSPKNPATEVFVKGQAVEGQALSAEDKALVIASLKDENKNGGTPNIEDSAKIRTENGKQVIDVTITHQDGSKSKISVPLKQDGTKPEITITYDTNNKLTKLDKTLPEIKIEASDANSGINGDVEVTGLPDYLTYDKTTKTIKFANGKTEIPKTAQDFTIKVKVKDKVGNEETKEQKITVQNQSDKYSPETITSDGKSPVRRYKGQEASKPETYVKDKEKLPDGTTYKWKNETGNPKLDTLGEVEKEIEITYPDDSKETVKVKFKVVEEIKLTKKDENLVLVNEKVEVGKQLQQEANKEKIKAKINGILDDSTVKFGAVKEESGKKLVPVTVEKDGERKEISIEVKEDTTKPVVSITNSDKDIITGETLPELKVEVTDENVDNDKVEVTVPSWLDYDKQTNTIKLKAGDKVPNTIADNEKKITVKATDKAGNIETKEITLTIKSQAEKYTPESKLNGSVKKVVGEATDKAENYIKDKDKLPTGTTFKWKDGNADTLTLDTVGKDQEKEVVVTFPDGSVKEVKVKFNVVDTKPSAPTVAVLKNGDVVITPSADSDKVVVGYTPKDSDKEKFVEATKDQGKWKLPEGFKEENGKIIIPDEITKNNTAVKVKASKGTSDYTTEKSTTITAKELQEVKTPVTIAGSDNKDTAVTENNKKLILDSLTSDQKGDADASIEQDAKIKEEAGKKYVEVKLEFKDKSTKVIKVPVVGDSTAPQVELSNDNQTVYKKEGFTEIKVNATDSNLADKPIEVQDLPSWLQYDETGKTIKFANGTTEVPTTATTTTVKVIAKDKVGNTTTKEIVITVKSQSDKYSPETLTSDGSKIKKVQGEQSNDAKSYVKNAKDLPEQTKYSWKDEKANPKFDQVGEVEKTITVTFPDGSEKEVKVKFNVVDTKPSEPAVAALKNGDVTITPSADSDKVVVGYTPKDKDKETLVEATKDQGKWKLPEGFKEENGKIIIPDEITQNNTTVKVKASKGTSDYTTEVTKQLSKTELLPPLKATISGSDAKDTVLTKENADLIIATLTNAQTGGATPSIKDGEKIKEDTDGSKYVEVTLTYDDQSTKVIKVKVVGDSTGPVFEGLGDTSVKKYETFKPIEIKATDAGSALRDNQPYEVENLPSWLEFDKATNKVKLANALTRVPKEATTVKFKVKAYDKFNNVTEQEVTVTVNEAEEFTFEKPVIIKGKDKDKEKLSPEDEKTILDAVRGTNKLDGAEPSIVDKTIKVSGDESSVDVTLTYDDNQTRVINVKVEQDAKLKFGLHLPSEKVEVNDINNLNQVEKAKVLEKVKLANSDLKEKDGYTYSIVAVTGQDKKAGTVTVSKDGKVVGELPGERLVKERDITKYDVALPKVKVQVENKTNLKADEKEKVKEALENATDAKGVSNKDKFPKGTTLEVQSDGTVIISYPDKTIKTISGSDLVDGGAPYVKTIAEEVTPKVPAEKVKVANPSSLDDKEIAKVKEKILEANKDTFPANTTVEVAKDGTATITYKDGSSDTIKNTDLVEKAKEKLTDAKQNPAVKPNAKVEVEDSKKLTDDEKAKVKENVKNTNPKAKDIVVGTDGTVEITYPDGSGNTIKPEDTVVQKAGKTPKESEAVKNPAKVPAVKVKVADTTKLTAEEIAKVKEEVTKVNPNATKVEVSSNGTATLTYKDGSENIVAGEKLVEQKAKGKTLAETVEILVPDVKTEVINPNRLSTAEKEKVKENLKAKNAGKLDSANITVQNNGTVTVEFADGSAKTIDGEKLVTKKADDGKLKPTIADLTDVVLPIHTKVAEYGKLTDSEKEAVKEAVITKNGEKLKDADIKVLGDGTVVITYKDKSTDIIPADKTVYVAQSGSEDLVQPALPEYPLDKLKPVADDFITEETQKIKDEINDSNIYSKEEKQKALAKIDEMVKKAKQKVQNAENDDKVLNTINEVLQDAKEFSKNIKENKLAEIAKAKAEAKAEIDKLANLTDEQKSGFKAEVDKAENLSDVKEVLDKAKVKDKEELAKAKAEAKAEIDKLANLTDEQKSSFKKEADKAKTKADVKEVLDKAKAKDKEELDKAKAEAKSQIDKLANLTDEQKSSFKKDIQAGKDKNTVAKILDKAKEANKKVKGKAGAKEKAKGQSTLAKTGLNTTNTVGLGAIISLIVLALRRKFKK